MKFPKDVYKIRKSVASDPGTREYLLIFLSFNTLVIYLYLYLEAINVLLKYTDLKNKFSHSRL